MWVNLGLYAHKLPQRAVSEGGKFYPKSLVVKIELQ